MEPRIRRTLKQEDGGEIQSPIISSSLYCTEANWKPDNSSPANPCQPRYHIPVPYSRLREVTKPKHISNEGQLSTRVSLVIVVILFLASICALLSVYKYFPELEEHEKQHIKLPWDIEDAKYLGQVLDRYKERYFFEVMFGVFLVYIFLQTFAIPGSLFLSILSGFLFPFWLALILVCTCSAIGASLCYFLSHLLGRKIVKKFFPERAAKWAEAVDNHKNHLLNYMIFLRVTPFLPNWFINLSAPVIGVPLIPFALGTFIGVAPPSFVAIQAGQTLHTLTSTSEAWSWTSVIVLSVFALISLVPVLLKRQLRDKLE